MIKAILIINNHGKVRLARFFARISQKNQQMLIRDVFTIVSKRSDMVCNFVEPSKTWQSRYRDLVNQKSKMVIDIHDESSVTEKKSKKSKKSKKKMTKKEKQKELAQKLKEKEKKKANALALDMEKRKMIEDREMAEFFDSKLIYRHYATLFFVFLVDQSESELGILDLIQVFVESLDQRFENVCELDIVFRFDEVNNILDEIVMAGMVLETNLNDIMMAVLGQKKHEKTSKTVAKKSTTVIKGHTG